MIRWAGVAFRVHAPRYAHQPISGDGAFAQGGRFNRPGVEALYLSLDLETAILEVGSGFRKLGKPKTHVCYAVDVADVVDLRTARSRRRAGVDLADLACPWHQDRQLGLYPPSWLVADRLIAAGAAGILVPSFQVGVRGGATNLVLWRFGPDPPHAVRPHDPEADLPRDGSSWR